MINPSVESSVVKPIIGAFSIETMHEDSLSEDSKGAGITIRGLNVRFPNTKEILRGALEEARIHGSIHIESECVVVLLTRFTTSTDILADVTNLKKCIRKKFEVAQASAENAGA